MSKHPIVALGAPTSALLLALSACADSPRASHDGPTLALTVAPVSYPGLADLCYSFTIVNGEDQLVVGLGAASTIADPTRNPSYPSWSANTPWTPNPPFANGTPLVCASQFGSAANGGLTYIAPCDASEGARDHTVTLWLDAFWAQGQPDPLTAGVDYQDPCPTGCRVTAPCRPNADTPVTFNLTVMRAANQGFFDIAVDFEDVFCSAKLDCVDAEGAPLTLLHDASGARAETVVLAFACTGGPEADTHLYLSDLALTCNPGTLSQTLSPSVGNGGNAYPAPLPAGSALVYQYAIYEGREQLGDLNKAYWNVAVGVDRGVLATATGCTLEATGTVSDGPLTNATTPANATYPFIHWSAPLGPDVNGALACGASGLDQGPRVTTAYTPPDTPRCFAHELATDWDTPGAPVVTAPTGACAPPPATAFIRYGYGTDRDQDGALNVPLAPVNPPYDDAWAGGYTLEVHPVGAFDYDAWLAGQPVASPLFTFTSSPTGPADFALPAGTYELVLWHWYDIGSDGEGNLYPVNWRVPIETCEGLPGTPSWLEFVGFVVGGFTPDFPPIVTLAPGQTIPVISWGRCMVSGG